TGYINHHHTSIYSDIEKTAQALGDRGIPMKNEIEGSLNTGLRQTATTAVTEMVEVWDDNSQELSQIPWTYAYYELAERNLIEDKLFEGFLDAQAKNLFSMTSRGDN
ncbi:MAG: 2-oxoadipate dioxygenase/decarboxylase family protein, partial [Waterburya sp.]